MSTSSSRILTEKSRLRSFSPE